MQEYSAAGAGCRWLIVEAQYDDEVVERIFSPKSFMASGIRQRNEPVVVGVVGIVAPAVGLFDGANAQSRLWWCNAIWTVEHAAQRKTAYGSCAVALALVLADAGMPYRASMRLVTPCQQSFRRNTDVHGYVIAKDSRLVERTRNWTWRTVAPV